MCLEWRHAYIHTHAHICVQVYLPIFFGHQTNLRHYARRCMHTRMWSYSFLSLRALTLLSALFPQFFDSHLSRMVLNNEVRMCVCCCCGCMYVCCYVDAYMRLVVLALGCILCDRRHTYVMTSSMTVFGPSTAGRLHQGGLEPSPQGKL